MVDKRMSWIWQANWECDNINTALCGKPNFRSRLRYAPLILKIDVDVKRQRGNSPPRDK
jgi:hypothetical protein